jgi:hypothetical protein
VRTLPNTVVDGNRLVSLTLGPGRTGTASAALGAQSTATLAITDNDVGGQIQAIFNVTRVRRDVGAFRRFPRTNPPRVVGDGAPVRRRPPPPPARTTELAKLGMLGREPGAGGVPCRGIAVGDLLPAPHDDDDGHRAQ